MAFSFEEVQILRVEQTGDSVLLLLVRAALLVAKRYGNAPIVLIQGRN